MGTALFSVSGMIKTVECFAVFTCLVIHRIGNRGSQVKIDVRGKDYLSELHCLGLVRNHRL